MKRSLEATEAHLYWCAVSNARQLMRDRAPLAEVEEHRDELEAIAIHTRWPRLRTLCYAAMLTIRPFEVLACALSG